MTEHRRFQVIAPDWGEAHLTPEAVVAYVDGELAPGPHGRAQQHLQHCADCAAEVVDQRKARSELRCADAPTLPTSLMSSLCSIPQDTELPPPPAGLAVTADGEMVSVLRPATTPGRRTRRRRIGAGAAVSGLAIGAIAFGLPASGFTTATPGGSTATFTGATPVARFAPAPRDQGRRPTSAPAASTSTSAPPTPTTPAPAPPRPAMQNVSLPPSP
ncbi:MAG: zf-HC2 domain-containing protein [Pseudonocardia sediminis]